MHFILNTKTVKAQNPQSRKETLSIIIKKTSSSWFRNLKQTQVFLKFFVLNQARLPDKLSRLHQRPHKHTRG